MSRILAVLPTFRRQSLLASSLDTLARQSRTPDWLVVVDNEGSCATREIVEAFAAEGAVQQVTYLAAPENLGSAGGWNLGMSHVLPHAHATDLVLPLDDDDPPQDTRDIERIFAFAREAYSRWPDLAGVGVVGARFNWWTGYLDRVPDEELVDEVWVDYLGSNHLPLYLASVMQREGPFWGALFFGYTEVEYCLRLRRQGYRFVCHGQMWRERRERAGRIGIHVKPSAYCQVHWRRYYVLRNYILIMKAAGRYDLAMQRSAVQLILKPMVTVFRSPRAAWQGFRLAARAVWDGFRGRTGRVIDPVTFGT